MTKKQGLVGRTHKAGTGACKKQAAARKLTVGGHKHTSLIGVPKPHAKPAAKPRTRVEEPPATGARTRSMPHDDVWLQADMCANPRCHRLSGQRGLEDPRARENDWKILELVPKTNVDKKVARASQKHVLAASTARKAAAITPGEIGFVATEDPDTRGYCVLTWQPAGAYTLQADKPTEFGLLTEGTLVADGEYNNPVGGAVGWHTDTPSPGNVTTVQVAHVLRTGVALLPISKSNPLPNNCDKTAARKAGALKVSPADHEAAMAESVRRDRLEYDNETASEEEESDEECEEEPEDSSDEQ